MAPKQHNRQYDLIVFGASGYTGKYTTQVIATTLPADLKWAIAGRSRNKLEKLVEELKTLQADRRPPEIEICSLDDEELSTLAKKTFILIALVGPYGMYGEPAFKACAENGTHYLDVTGEGPFPARMIKKYEETAKRTGSMCFPQVGLESAVPDLITWSLAKVNRTEFSAPTRDVTVSIHNLDSVPSGGTLNSALGMFDSFSLKELRDLSKPFGLSPVPGNTASIKKRSFLNKLFGTQRVPHLGTLTTYIAGSSDVAMIERTWGLLTQIPSKANEQYGPNFSVREFMKTSNFLTGIFIHWTLAVASVLLAALPPLRKLAKKLVYKQGEGPDTEKSKKDELEYRAVANPDVKEPVGRQAFAQAWFHGSMYQLTGILLAQTAATLLEDNIELGGGGIFTAACLGQRLVDRLDGAGFKIEAKTIPV